MKYRILVALSFISCTFVALPMDWPEQEESSFANLPLEVQEKIIKSLIQPVQGLLDDSLTKFMNATLLTVKGKKLHPVDKALKEQVQRLKDQFNNNWKKVFSLISSNKNTQSLLNDPVFKKELLNRIILSVTRRNLVDALIFVPELLAIANYLNIQLSDDVQDKGLKILAYILAQTELAHLRSDVQLRRALKELIVLAVHLTQQRKQNVEKNKLIDQWIAFYAQAVQLLINHGASFSPTDKEDFPQALSALQDWYREYLQKSMPAKENQ